MCSLFLDLLLPFQDLGCRELNLGPTRFYSYLKMAKHYFKILADTQSDTDVEIERTILILKTKKGSRLFTSHHEYVLVVEREH